MNECNWPASGHGIRGSLPHKKRLFQPPDRAPQIETCGNQIVQDLIWRHLSQAQTTGSSDPISIVTKQLWVLAPSIPPIRLGEVPYRFMEAPATS